MIGGGLFANAVATALIAALATVLVMNGHSGGVSQVVGAAMAVLAVFVGGPDKPTHDWLISARPFSSVTSGE